MTRQLTRVCGGLVLTALAACGGGGGDDAPAPAPVASLAVSGTVATGHAVAGAQVDVRCASGSAAAMTGIDGTYAVSIAGGAGPCAVRAATPAQTLHGIAAGSGTALRANVTPLTELAVARLSGSAAADFFAGFGTASASTATATAVQSAASGVIAQLRSGGIDFGPAGDVMGGTLIAAHGTVPGDVHDQRLDALAAGLTAGGTTLVELSQAIVRATPSAPAASRSTTISLPPDRLIQARAADCPSLRSGRYRFVRSVAGAAASTELVTVEAPTLRFTDASGSVTLTALGDCAYTGPSGGQFAVSRAGVAIARASRGNGLFDGGLVVPEQDHHAVADLSGDWTTIAFERTAANGAVHATSGDITLDATGRSTAVSVCDDIVTCVAQGGAAATSITVTANAAGGFDLVDATRSTSARLFAYRVGGGELLAASVTSNGQLTFWARKMASPLPPVGRTNTGSNLFLATDYGVAAALNASEHTVVSVDPQTRVVVRNGVSNFTTGVTRPETLTYDAPRVGLTRRAAGVVTQSNGVPTLVTEFITLNPVGSGLSAFALPASQQLGLSVVVRSTP